MHFPEGFLLGLSTGAVCLAYCGPVLMPYLLGEGTNVRNNVISVSLFMGGRLLAYILVGFAAGWVGTVLMQPSRGKMVFFGIIYMALAILMIAYGFHRFREICLGHAKGGLKSGFLENWPILLPVSGGFITGLNLCPPFLLAIAGSVEENSVRGSILFFILFFLGTAIYFIPLPFIGFFRRQQVLRTIGKFASILAGIFYFYKGTLILIAGYSQPSI